MIEEGPAEVVPLVVDNGSGTSRAGFAGENFPISVFPTLVGVPKQKFVSNCKDLCLGHEVLANKEHFSLLHPIEQGIVTNWDHMEKIWHYTFNNELHVETHQHSILLTEPALNPKANREMMSQIIFETFSFSGMAVMLQGILSIFAAGRNTAVSVEIGDGVIHTMPITEGFAIKSAIRRLNVRIFVAILFGNVNLLKMAGGDLTNYLMNLLMKRGYNFTTSSEREIVRDIKEKICYVAYNYDTELQKASATKELEMKYELPDGSSITVGNERFQCPEALFKPHLLGYEAIAIHQLVFDTIRRCDIDTRKNFYGNILLSGGSTLFPRLADRLQKEMVKLAPVTMKIKIVAPPERKHSAWIGGSIFAALSIFNKNCISLEEYKVSGFCKSLKLLF